MAGGWKARQGVPAPAAGAPVAALVEHEAGVEAECVGRPGRGCRGVPACVAIDPDAGDAGDDGHRQAPVPSRAAVRNARSRVAKSRTVRMRSSTSSKTLYIWPPSLAPGGSG